MMNQVLGNSEKQWDSAVLDYSLSHQLRWKKNLGESRDYTDTAAAAAAVALFLPVLICTLGRLVSHRRFLFFLLPLRKSSCAVVIL